MAGRSRPKNLAALPQPNEIEAVLDRAVAQMAQTPWSVVQAIYGPDPAGAWAEPSQTPPLTGPQIEALFWKGWNRSDIFLEQFPKPVISALRLSEHSAAKLGYFLPPARVRVRKRQVALIVEDVVDSPAAEEGADAAELGGERAEPVPSSGDSAPSSPAEIAEAEKLAERAAEWRRLEAIFPGAPIEYADLLGEPLLLPWESLENYSGLFGILGKTLAPEDPIEWMIVKDLTDQFMEIERIKLAKKQLIISNQGTILYETLPSHWVEEGNEREGFRVIDGYLRGDRAATEQMWSKLIDAGKVAEFGDKTFLKSLTEQKVVDALLAVVSMRRSSTLASFDRRRLAKVRQRLAEMILELRVSAAEIDVVRD